MIAGLRLPRPVVMFVGVGLQLAAAAVGVAVPPARDAVWAVYACGVALQVLWLAALVGHYRATRPRGS